MLLYISMIMLSAPDVLVANVSKDVIQEAFEAQNNHTTLLVEQTEAIRELVLEIKNNTETMTNLISTIEANGSVEVVYIQQPVAVEQKESPKTKMNLFVAIGVVLLTTGISFLIMVLAIKYGNIEYDG